MTEIEQLVNDDGALRNITDCNDYQCRHQIIIFIKIVSDAAPLVPKMGIGPVFLPPLYKTYIDGSCSIDRINVSLVSPVNRQVYSDGFP